MKRLALALLLCLISFAAMAQSTVSVIGPITPGDCVAFNSQTIIKDAGTTCGSSGAGVPGGSSGQVQFNSAGAFGGFTANGDASINTATGAVTVTKTNGNAFGAFATQVTPVTTAQGGTGVSNSTNAANDVLASNGANGNFVHTTLLTLINAVCTLAPGTCSNIFGYVSPYWYSAACDGTTNDNTAFQNMLTASANLTIRLPAATCVVTVLTAPSGTTIVGVGWDSILKSSNATSATLNTSSASNIRFENFALLGTDSSTAPPTSSNGGIAIVGGGNNIIIRKIKLSGFNATYWVYFSNQSSTSTSNVLVENNYWVTTPSDVPAGTPNNNTNWGMVFFSGTAGVNYNQLTIRNNRMDGAAFCYGVILFSDFFKYQIQDNQFYNMGQNTTSHCNDGTGTITLAYGIAVYDLNGDGNPPQVGIISGNMIYNVVATGIYVVTNGATAATTTEQLIITNNQIQNVLYQNDATLPRAAIVVNQGTDVLVSNNFCYGNYGCVATAAQVGGVIDIEGNFCYTAVGVGVGAPTCIRITAGASNNTRYTVRGNHLDIGSAGDTAALFASLTGSRFASLDFDSNTIFTISGSTGVNFANNFVTGIAAFTNNSFFGAGTLALFGGVTGSFLGLYNNNNLSFTAATLPAAFNGSNAFVSDGAPASSPCTGSSTGSMAFRQNGAWKCF
jgi:hypothetical protein